MDPLAKLLLVLDDLGNHLLLPLGLILHALLLAKFAALQPGWRGLERVEVHALVELDCIVGGQACSLRHARDHGFELDYFAACVLDDGSGVPILLGSLDLHIEDLEVVVLITTANRIEDIDLLDLWFLVLGQRAMVDVVFLSDFRVTLILDQLLEVVPALRELRQVEVLLVLILVVESLVSGIDLGQKLRRLHFHI